MKDIFLSLPIITLFEALGRRANDEEWRNADDLYIIVSKDKRGDFKAVGYVEFYEGTEGQDRENYTDAQDRENYIVDDKWEEQDYG